MEFNCPNCGAPKDGAVCAYCGTVLDAGAVVNMALGKEVHVRFEHMGCLYEFTMCIDQLEMEAEYEPFSFYGDGYARRYLSTPEYLVGINGRVVPGAVRGRDDVFCVRQLAPHEMTT